MKVLVCGSRDWNGVVKLRERLTALPEGTEVIHGGARGADRDAAMICAELGISTRAFRADWDRFGKSAGAIRNIQMLDEDPDLVIAFWDGESRGTRHTVEEATKRGIPVEVIT